MPAPDYEGFVKELTDLSRKYGIHLVGDDSELVGMWLIEKPGHYERQGEPMYAPFDQWVMWIEES